MSSELKLRRGSTAAHTTFTGADGEVTFDTDKNVIVSHDGATIGGFPHTKAADLAASSGSSLVGYLPAGTGAVATDLASLLDAQTKSFFNYLTDAQIAAVRSNNYSGIDMTLFTDAVQAFFTDSLSGEIPDRCAIKVNRPIYLDSFRLTKCIGNGVSNGGVGSYFYPDLSINWNSVYPDQGVLQTRNFMWPTAYAVPGAKPDYWTIAGLENISVNCEKDTALYASNPERVPDYGIVIWCPNEEAYIRRCRGSYARKHNILFGGLLSVPQIEDCSGFHAGIGQNTVFGDAVTRTASAFTAPVTVYYSAYETTTLFVEAATVTDLNTLANGDVLTVNGTTYTVNAVPPATVTEVEPTTRSGVASTTTYSRKLTLSAIITANGRVFPSGLAFTNHPSLSFAPGISSSNGGRGNGGSARIFGFSGDTNVGSLVYLDGPHSIIFAGPKAEQHSSMVRIGGVNTGNTRARIEITGYRSESGTTLTQRDVVTIQNIAYPQVFISAGSCYNAINLIRDKSANVIITKQSEGFFCFYDQQSEFSMRTRSAVLPSSLILQSDNTSDSATVTVITPLSPTNYRWNWDCRVTGSERYRWRVGPSLSTVYSVDENSGDGFHLWSYNGTTTEKLIKLYSVANVAAVQIGLLAEHKVGFYGATPVIKQAITGARGGNAALASLLTQLAAIGLVTDSTTA